jgi:hypothetical protein
MMLSLGIYLMDLQEARKNWLNTVSKYANNVNITESYQIPAENVDVL